MPTYQPLVPTGTVPLNTDYANLQGNFQQANTVVGIDHSALTVSTNEMGYHKSIHMIPQASITNTPGFGQLYSKTVNSYSTDQALFWDTGDGNQNIQMTSNFLPSLSATPGFTTNGYTFLPGGFILQWGLTNPSVSTNVQIIYAAQGNIIFPNNTLNVTATATRSSGTFTTNFSVIGLLNTGFFIVNSNSSTTSLQYYWQAIGY